MCGVVGLFFLIFCRGWGCVRVRVVNILGWVTEVRDSRVAVCVRVCQGGARVVRGSWNLV